MGVRRPSHAIPPRATDGQSSGARPPKRPHHAAPVVPSHLRRRPARRLGLRHPGAGRQPAPGLAGVRPRLRPLRERNRDRCGEEGGVRPLRGVTAAREGRGVCRCGEREVSASAGESWVHEREGVSRRYAMPRGVSRDVSRVLIP